MTNGQKADLARDFAKTFDGVEPSEIDAEAVYNWAKNTQAFYDWFYTRFEAMANQFNASGDAHTLHKECPAPFLGWNPHETHPSKMADCIRGIFNGLKLRLYGVDHKAADLIYEDYLQQWREQINPRYCVVKLTFYHGRSREIYVNANQTDEQIANQFIGYKQDDDKNDFSRVVSVETSRVYKLIPRRSFG